jgi:hypothetical protein
MIRAVSVGFLLLLVAVLGFSLLQRHRQRSAIDVPIYADLQQIEFEHRSAKLAGPLFLLGAGAAGDVIGVPTKDSRYPNVWLAAEKTSPDGGVYLVPHDALVPHNAVFAAPCDSVRRLLATLVLTRPVSPAARDFLSRHCLQ